MPIHIQNVDDLRRRLQMLQPDAKPLWGNMTPQMMVEHMIDQVEHTNGKKTPTQDVTNEQALEGKKKWIYTDAVIPRNVFLKVMGGTYLYPDLQSASAQLIEEVKLFHEHFKQPGLQVIHGGFGPLTYQEWIIWHNKHFTHHLGQFGLLEGLP